MLYAFVYVIVYSLVRRRPGEPAFRGMKPALLTCVWARAVSPCNGRACARQGARRARWATAREELAQCAGAGTAHPAPTLPTGLPGVVVGSCSGACAPARPPFCPPRAAVPPSPEPRQVWGTVDIRDRVRDSSGPGVLLSEKCRARC